MKPKDIVDMAKNLKACGFKEETIRGIIKDALDADNKGKTSSPESAHKHSHTEVKPKVSRAEARGREEFFNSKGKGSPNKGKASSSFMTYEDAVKLFKRYRADGFSRRQGIKMFLADELVGKGMTITLTAFCKAVDDEDAFKTVPIKFRKKATEKRLPEFGAKAPNYKDNAETCLESMFRQNHLDRITSDPYRFIVKR